MFIERDFSKGKVPDFIMNVKPHLNDFRIAEEVYDDEMRSMVIGWKISEIKRR